MDSHLVIDFPKGSVVFPVTKPSIDLANTGKTEEKSINAFIAPRYGPTPGIANKPI